MCTAVGTGFIIAGTVGYLVKLSTGFPKSPHDQETSPTNTLAVHVPLNNVLVAGA